MAVRDFKKFFKRRGRFVKQPHNDRKTFQRSRADKNDKSDRKCFRCGDPNHLIGECLKPPKDKKQRAFVGGFWSDRSEEDDEKAKDETYLVAQASNEICLGVDLEPDEWIKDSGCSKHMTGNRKLFLSYKIYNGGNDIFGSNIRGIIIGKGQICDNKYRVTFSKHDSEITKDGKVIGRGIRKNGLYVMKLENKPEDKICLATIDENSTLWHGRLAPPTDPPNTLDGSRRAKVTEIEEPKDLSSVDLDELIGNLKVHEVVMKKDSKIYKGKKERVKSITLKAKKESSDETLTSRSDDEEYAMTVRNFKKFFRRKGKFVRQPREEKKSFRQTDGKKGKSDRKCF
nr:retrotransposon protein [Tanacetum cinerariifolium]